MLKLLLGGTALQAQGLAALALYLHTCFSALPSQAQQVYAFVDTVQNFALVSQTAKLNIGQVISSEIGDLTNVTDPTTRSTPAASSTLYGVSSSGTHYLLFKSPLPLLSITTDTAIVVYPKVAAQLKYIDENRSIEEYFAGIEWRGHTSLLYPKKTYDIELRVSPTDDTEVDAPFAGLRSDGDWVLDALYNEPLRLRSVFLHNLWVDTHELYYHADKPGVLAGARAQHVEVFVNGKYQGIYGLMEQVDRKQLKLKKNRNDLVRGTLARSVAYTPTTTFDTLLSPTAGALEYDGYEWKYPRKMSDWQDLQGLTEVVIMQDSSSAYASLDSLLEMPNLIDYFLFVNLARLQDNLGKNVYWCRRDTGEQMFVAPWDLDAGLGNDFRGFPSLETEGFRQNKLTQLLWRDPQQRFTLACSRRYRQLRETIWSTESLLTRIRSLYTQLADSGAYAREGSTWQRLEAGADGLNRLETWLLARLEWLDMELGYP